CYRISPKMLVSLDPSVHALYSPSLAASLVVPSKSDLVIKAAPCALHGWNSRTRQPHALAEAGHENGCYRCDYQAGKFWSLTERSQLVLFRCPPECLQGLRVQVAGGEGAFGGEVAEAHQGVHEGQLSGLIQLQTRDAPAVGKKCRLGELAKFLAVHKGFQNILLHLQIAVDDAV